jgi:hypothetical protein
MGDIFDQVATQSQGAPAQGDIFDRLAAATASPASHPVGAFIERHPWLDAAVTGAAKAESAIGNVLNYPAEKTAEQMENPSVSPEFNAALQQRPGYNQVVGFVSQMNNPLYNPYVLGAVGDVAPIAGRLVSGGFAGAGAVGAVQEARQGHYGAAAENAIMGTLAGIGAARGEPAAAPEPETAPYSDIFDRLWEYGKRQELQGGDVIDRLNRQATADKIIAGAPVKVDRPFEEPAILTAPPKPTAMEQLSAEAEQARQEIAERQAAEEAAQPYRVIERRRMPSAILTPSEMKSFVPTIDDAEELSPAQKALEEQAKAQTQAEYPQLVSKYIADHTGGDGKLYVNADSAKPLIGVYGKTAQEHAVSTAPVHNSSAVIAKGAFEYGLTHWTDPASDVVNFVTGMQGTGKTHMALRGAFDDAGITYERNMGHLATARDAIEKTLDAGKQPVIKALVPTDPINSLDQAITRPKNGGHAVRIKQMAALYHGVAQAVPKLKQEFGDNLRVDVFLKDNGGHTPVSGQQAIDVLRSIAQNQSEKELYESLKQRLDEHRAAGNLTDKEYEAFAPLHSRGNGGNSESGAPPVASPESSGGTPGLLRFPEAPQSKPSASAGERQLRGPRPEQYAGRESLTSLPEASALPGRAPSNIRVVPTSEINVDPERFQFRIMPGRAGLENVTRYDPEKAGIISVWRDPADGKTYVVNGHHRIRLAQRLGQPEVVAHYLDAPNAKAARSTGAMINIAEGNASPVDAAKLFRDTNATPESLAAEGVSLSGPVARDGLALSKLSDPLFNEVATGRMTSGRGAAIGSVTDNPATQKAILALVAKAEKGGKRLSDLEVHELGRFAVTSPTGAKVEATLFGPEMLRKNYAVEKAKLSSYIISRLGKERLFGTVAKRAEDLARAGNAINVEESERIAQEAAQARVVYDKLSAFRGPVSDALNAGAKELGEGGDANAIQERTYQAVLRGVKETLAGRARGGGEGTEANAPGGPQVSLHEADRTNQAGQAGDVEEIPFQWGYEEGFESRDENLNPYRPGSLAWQGYQAGIDDATRPTGPQAPKVEPPGTTFYSGIDPALIGHGVGRMREAYERHVAEPLIRAIGTGPAHGVVDRDDPALAIKLRQLDAAPAYYRAKAARIVNTVVGKLSREQERLLTLMADKQSRENLEANHPEEYHAALRDPAIQAAMGRYRPFENELTRAHEALGGNVLNDRDYLRRVYQEHTSGVGRPLTPGEQAAPPLFDRVITPQRAPMESREAAAEYHYQNGLHEFGPAFATKYVGTMLRKAEHDAAQEFLGNATRIEPGEDLPASITYLGKRFYRPDVVQAIREARPGAQSEALARELGVRQLPKPGNAQPYGRYDPASFPQQQFQPDQAAWLGPRSIVEEMRNRDAAYPEGLGPVGRFMREQIIGLGFGVPHLMNIARRMAQASEGGVANPVAWVKVARALFGKRMGERALAGTDDAMFERLAKSGGISPGNVETYKEYWGGNLNPANWLRIFAKVGHDYLFKPGGIDQRARLYVADMVKQAHPEISDDRLAQLINDQLGRYSRMTWTKGMKSVGRFMLFPGWDYSSINWALRHPIRTTVPAAFLTLLANNIVNDLGGNQSKDTYDFRHVHLGNRAVMPGLLHEPLASRLADPVLQYVMSRSQGKTPVQAGAEGAALMPNIPKAAIGMLVPPAVAAGEEAFNQRLYGGQLVPRRDMRRPGAVLPSKRAEDLIAHQALSVLPEVGRLSGEGHPADPLSSLLGNVGLYTYKQQPRRRRMRTPYP